MLLAFKDRTSNPNDYYYRMIVRMIPQESLSQSLTIYHRFTFDIWFRFLVQSQMQIERLSAVLSGGGGSDNCACGPAGTGHGATGLSISPGPPTQHGMLSTFGMSGGCTLHGGMVNCLYSVISLLMACRSVTMNI